MVDRTLSELYPLFVIVASAWVLYIVVLLGYVD